MLELYDQGLLLELGLLICLGKLYYLQDLESEYEHKWEGNLLFTD